MVEIIWVNGENKKALPIINGYLFYFKRANGPEVTRLVWRCSVKRCRTSAIFTEDGGLIMKGEHDHSTDEKKIYKMIFVDHLRQILQQNPFISANTAFADTVAALNSAFSYNTDITRHFPSFGSVKSITYRIKRDYYPSSYNDLLSNLDLSKFILPDGADMLLFHETAINPMIILGEKTS